MHRTVARTRRLTADAVELYWGTGLCDDVPALSWFLAVALVPLALGMTALASIALGDYAQAQAVAERAAGVLPPDVRDQLVQLILRTESDSGWLLAASVAGMVWTSSGAVGVIERVMSRLLQRERFGPLTGKARHLGLAGAVVVTIVLMALAASKVTGLRVRLGLDGAGAQVLVTAGATLASAVVCAGLYRFSPRDGIPWRAAMTGALPAAVALQLIPTAVAFYLRLVAGRTPVQVFLVLAGVLFTCYVAALVLLLGSAVAARTSSQAGDVVGSRRVSRSESSAVSATAPSDSRSASSCASL
ncbi:MAG TPA: YihY/virulence factor BrkB family protein [Baekduia sp.]|uniref:YihY/virulence factor BrkB family protein n=1 Tax=Baekduia sp. TaxID=2600305 RepID=UPI002C49A233|nr:YihY/virulence factor BrkB family protein [Baekduia sp.]HMJ34242.1 YihY/virulence factor BrkB family protein [Baekduia sp.]